MRAFQMQPAPQTVPQTNEWRKLSVLWREWRRLNDAETCNRWAREALCGRFGVMAVSRHYNAVCAALDNLDAEHIVRVNNAEMATSRLLGMQYLSTGRAA